MSLSLHLVCVSCVTLPFYPSKSCTPSCPSALTPNRLLTAGGSTADYDKRTALHLASSEGHLDIVAFLIKNHAEVNCTDRMGFSPLVDALRHGHVTVQKLLRSKGGQLLGMDVSVELCKSAAEGDVPRLQALIDNGANPNACDYDSRTGLLSVSFRLPLSFSFSLLSPLFPWFLPPKLYLARYPDNSQCTARGMAALHLAASNGEASVLDYFLRQLGEVINVNPLDRLGGTPLDDAYRHNQTVAVAMLESKGGLRKGSPELIAIEIQMKKEAEELQRKGRLNDVTAAVEASPETKACVWIKGRCGKLLSVHLNDMAQYEQQLMEGLTELSRAVHHWLASTIGEDANVMDASPEQNGRLRSSRISSEFAIRESLTGKRYRKVVDLALDANYAIKQWRLVGHSALNVLTEELPNCRGATIFSKAYKEEVKKFTEVCVCGCAC